MNGIDASVAAAAAALPSVLAVVMRERESEEAPMRRREIGDGWIDI